jgi:hypothetical protein
MDTVELDLRLRDFGVQTSVCFSIETVPASFFTSFWLLKRLESSPFLLGVCVDSCSFKFFNRFIENTS